MLFYHIKKILVPTDFSKLSENALCHAELIAKYMASDIELLHVLNPNKSDDLECPEKDYYEFLIIKVKLKLKRIADLLVNKHIRAFLNTKMGTTVDSIVNAAVETESDLIVMGCNNSPMDNKFCTKAVDIVRNARCPIIIVQSEVEFHSYDKIVVPIRNQAHILDKMIYAISLAKMSGSTIHLVLFYPNFNDSVANKEVTNIFKKALELLNTYNIKASYTCIMGGHYVRDTLLVAKKQRANLIVISANQSNFFQRIWDKTEEDKFLIKSKIPLLTIPFGYNGLSEGHHKSDDNLHSNSPTLSMSAIAAQN